MTAVKQHIKAILGEIPKAVTIRFKHAQVGMQVEAKSKTGSWETVSIENYGDTLDTKRTERLYIARIEQKGFRVTVERLHA